MEVFINSKAHHLDDNCSLIFMLNSLKIKQEGIAIAINQNVIPQKRWNETYLKDNDQILIIQASAGG